MDPEDILLSERGLSQKDTYSVVPGHELLETAKLLETESQVVVPRGWGEGDMRGCCSIPIIQEEAVEICYIILHLQVTILYLLRA